ncbi:toxin CcdB [Sphingomonas sp. UYAg733]
MARFDVHHLPGGGGFLLDCQTDYLDDLETRLTVPLIRRGDAPPPARRLNPVFDVEGEAVVMMTQYAAAIRSSHLGPRVTSLADQQDAIMAAIDMLLSGY